MVIRLSTDQSGHSSANQESRQTDRLKWAVNWRFGGSSHLLPFPSSTAAWCGSDCHSQESRVAWLAVCQTVWRGGGNGARVSRSTEGEKKWCTVTVCRLMNWTNTSLDIESSLDLITSTGTRCHLSSLWLKEYTDFLLLVINDLAFVI